MSVLAWTSDCVPCIWDCFHLPFNLLTRTATRYWLSASGLADARRDIKHLYHYYLHGSSGRRGGQERSAALRDGLAPEIVIQCIKNNRLDWRKNLIDVCDDMESKYLEVNHVAVIMPVTSRLLMRCTGLLLSLAVSDMLIH